MPAKRSAAGSTEHWTRPCTSGPRREFEKWEWVTYLLESAADKFPEPADGGHQRVLGWTYCIVCRRFRVRHAGSVSNPVTFKLCGLPASSAAAALSALLRCYAAIPGLGEQPPQGIRRLGQVSCTCKQGEIFQRNFTGTRTDALSHANTTASKHTPACRLCTYFFGVPLATGHACTDTSPP